MCHIEDLLAHNVHKEIGELADGQKMYRRATAVDKQLQGFSYGSSNSKLTWQGIYATPMITIEGVGYVYCIEPKKSAPSGNRYDQGTAVSDQGVKALLQSGFPYYNGNLTDQEAYIRTFVALNGYLGMFNRRSIESYDDPYVNRLLKQADQGTISKIALSILAPTSVLMVYNEKTQRLETDFYQVKGEQGKFWIEALPTSVYPVNEKGERFDTLPIGSKFRIVSEDMSLADKLNFKINTDIKAMEVMRYRADGVQDVLALQAKGTISPIDSRVVIQPHIIDKIDEKKETSKRQGLANQQERDISHRVWNQPILVQTGQSIWHITLAFGLSIAGILFLYVKRFLYEKR